MAKKNDFEVMTEMIDKGLEIACSPHFVSAQTARGGGHVTMGIETGWLHKMALMPMKYRCILYVVNKEHYDSIQTADTPLSQSNPVQECLELTLPGAWKRLHELADRYAEHDAPAVFYSELPPAFLPDLKAFEVGQTQSDAAGPGTVDRRVFVDWLLKIFHRGFDYQIHFKTDVDDDPLDGNPRS